MPSKPQVLVFAPEKHIPVPYQAVFDAVKAQVPLAHRDAFEEVCTTLQCISRIDTMQNRERLKQTFHMFSAGAKKVQLLLPKEEPLPTAAELNGHEMAFLLDFGKVMSQAHYKPLKSHEWHAALEQQFQFWLPIKVNWDALDTELLSKYWESSEDLKAEREHLPEIADRALIFVRGIGQTKKTDLFIWEKIDMIAGYMVQPIVSVWHWVKRLWSKKPAPVQQPPPLDPHHHNVTVRRFSLKQQMPNVLAVLCKLFSTLEVLEPTFKEVVVLYRKSTPPEQQAAAAEGGMQHSKDGSGDEQEQLQAKRQQLMELLQQRNIYLKGFGEIAMADIELIFPEKTVLFKPFAVIQLSITGVLGAVAGVGLLLHGFGLGAFASFMGLVAGRAFQIWNDSQVAMTFQMNDLNSLLYDKSRDAHEGVLMHLVESMVEQQQKEAVLALGKLLLEAEASDTATTSSSSGSSGKSSSASSSRSLTSTTSITRNTSATSNTSTSGSSTSGWSSADASSSSSSSSSSSTGGDGGSTSSTSSSSPAGSASSGSGTAAGSSTGSSTGSSSSSSSSNGGSSSSSGTGSSASSYGDGSMLSRDHVAALDAACERFLHQEFGVRVDFALENTLPHLLKWGLVLEAKEGRLEAVPLSEAKAALDAYWTKTLDQLAAAGLDARAAAALPLPLPAAAMAPLAAKAQPLSASPPLSPPPAPTSPLPAASIPSLPVVSVAATIPPGPMRPVPAPAPTPSPAAAPPPAPVLPVAPALTQE